MTISHLSGAGRPRLLRRGLILEYSTLSCAPMLALAFGKARTGVALNNPVLKTEGRVTLVDTLHHE